MRTPRQPPPETTDDPGTRGTEGRAAGSSSTSSLPGRVRRHLWGYRGGSAPFLGRTGAECRKRRGLSKLILNCRPMPTQSRHGRRIVRRRVPDRGGGGQNHHARGRYGAPQSRQPGRARLCVASRFGKGGQRAARTGRAGCGAALGAVAALRLPRAQGRAGTGWVLAARTDFSQRRCFVMMVNPFTRHPRHPGHGAIWAPDCGKDMAIRRRFAAVQGSFLVPVPETIRAG